MSVRTTPSRPRGGRSGPGSSSGTGSSGGAGGGGPPVARAAAPEVGSAEKWEMLTRLVNTPAMVALRTERPVAERLRLAADAGTPAEVLFVLSHDSDDSVRAAVAGNERAPSFANEVLSNDAAPKVRRTLAERLGGMIRRRVHEEARPQIQEDLEVVERLSKDKSLEVRLAVANAIRDIAKIPSKVAVGLAKDYERDVAKPLLRHSPLLSDQDLQGLVTHHRDSWALTAIAQREVVSGPVSEAILARRDLPSTEAVIDNKGAVITERGYEHALETTVRAPRVQEKMAQRPGLTARIARALTKFAGATVGQYLADREDLDSETRRAIAQTVERRMKWIEDRRGTDQRAAARGDFKRGQITGDALLDALSFDWDDYVTAALALMARVDEPTVIQVRQSDSGRSVTALAWRAKQTMRVALDLQMKWAKVARDKLIYPKNGEDWGLTEDEMEWQLDLFGI